MGYEAIYRFMYGLAVFYVGNHHVEVLEAIDIFFDALILLQIHQFITSSPIFIYNAKLCLDFITEIIK